MTRKKWSFLFTVCLVTALIGCGQKNSQVDKNNNEEMKVLDNVSDHKERTCIEHEKNKK